MKSKPKPSQHGWESPDNAEDALLSRHKAGSPIAVDECVLACAEAGTRLPKWAIDVLAVRSRRRIWQMDQRLHRKNKKWPPISLWLYGESPLRDPGGRGREADFFKQQFLVAYVRQARLYGFRGDRAFDKAVEGLKAIGVHYTIDTAKKRFHALKRKLRLNEDDVEYLARHLDDFLRAAGNETTRVSSGRRD